MSIHDKIFIHQGSDIIDETIRIKPREFRRMSKPDFGFWVAPEIEGYVSTWDKWCQDEDYCLPHRDNDKIIKMKIKPSARILIIDSYEDLEKVFHEYPLAECHQLDWVKISENYDAVYLTEEGQYSTRMTTPLNLYGWDLESAVIFNYDVIQII